MWQREKVHVKEIHTVRRRSVAAVGRRMSDEESRFLGFMRLGPEVN
jgi:hypothetical protein